MDKKPSRPVLTIIILTILLICILIWARDASQQKQRNDTEYIRIKDFVAFYTAGSVANEYGIENTYNIELQKSAQEKVLGFPLNNSQPLLYNHLPFLIPILMLISKAPYTLAFSIWTMLQLVVYGTCFYFLRKYIRDTKLIISASLFSPIFISLLLGQDTVFLFAGLVLIIIGLAEEKNFLTGTGVALTTVRPHIAIPLILALTIAQKKGRIKLLIPSALLTLASILMIGWEGTQSFTNILLISGKGEWFGMNESAMPNLTGLIIRILPSLKAEQLHQITWGGYILLLLFLIIWELRKKENDPVNLYVIVTLSAFFAPHLHSHDLSILILPVIFLIKNTKPSPTLLFPIIILIFSILLFFSYASPMYYGLIYSLMMALIVLGVKEKHKMAEGILI